MLDPYVEHVIGFIDPAVIKPFNVVLDAGCGIGGLVAPRLFDRLPCRTTRLCFTIDGTFPTHEANPLIEENRRDIVEEVVRQKADIGIAWDGDADRCFFIDGGGEFVPGDFVTALLAEAFLIKHPGATILYDLRASYAVKDTVARYGGTALMNRVGHAFIKRRMREENAIFGGEVTGHYYFRDILLRRQRLHPGAADPGADVAQGTDPRGTARAAAGEVLHLGRDQHQGRQHGGGRTRSSAAWPPKYADAKVYELDGVSVEYPDWHFNVRPSNTEPLLRLNLEGQTPALMEAKRDEVLAFIRG